jgi:hypothetical protein
MQTLKTKETINKKIYILAVTYGARTNARTLCLGRALQH